MRPLPRLLAFTTDAVCRAGDFGARAAAVASVGPAAAIVVRAPESNAAQLGVFAERVMALARPPEAAVVVHGRPDLARAIGAAGVQLRRSDLPPADARRVLGSGWVGASVHDVEEAAAARNGGADFLVAGSVFESATHPGRPGRGVAWLRSLASLGTPVFAIGGVTAAQAASLRDAGAWGVAVIRAVWEAADPAAAAFELVSTWT